LMPRKCPDTEQVVAPGALFGRIRQGPVEERDHLSEEFHEPKFILWNLDPGQLTGYGLASLPDVRAVVGLEVKKTKPSYGLKPQGIRGRVLKCVGVCMELAGIHEGLLLVGSCNLEVRHSVRPIIE